MPWRLWNPSTGEAETGASPHLTGYLRTRIRELQTPAKSCLEEQCREWWQKTPDMNLLPESTSTNTRGYAQPCILIPHRERDRMMEERRGRRERTGREGGRKSPRFPQFWVWLGPEILAGVLGLLLWIVQGPYFEVYQEDCNFGYRQNSMQLEK